MKRRALGNTIRSSEPTLRLNAFTLSRQRLAGIVDVRGESREAFVELHRQPAYLRGVLGERRLLPAVRNGLEQRNQARRRR